MARKEFTADSGLGFMRFVQFTNFFVILMNFIALAVLTTSQMNAVSGYVFFVIILDIIGEGVCIWMIGNRKMYTRQYAIVFYVFNCINFTVENIMAGYTDPVFFVVPICITLGFALYFLTSRRAKAVLVQPFASGLRNKDLAIGRKMFNPRSLDFWLRLLIYFFFFSVAGHWMEMGVQILIVNGLFPGTIAAPDSLTWKDHFGPFCIYGIAFVVCGLVLYPLYMKMREVFPKTWQAFVCSFIVNALFCGLAELVLGLLFNTDFQAWDYRDQFLNFEGQVCFLYTICFGVVSSIIVWQVYPTLERQFSYVGRDVFRVIFVASLLLFVALVLAYNIDPVKTFGFQLSDEQAQLG
jgi:uncharacterized membrane protein